MLLERKIIKHKVKIKDIEGKIPSITNLATNSALNPIQNGEGKGKKAPLPPLYQFSPVTNTNIWIGPQTFLTLVLTLLPHTDFKATTSAGPKLLNLNQEHPSKK